MIVFSSILSQSKESRPTGRTYVSRSGECQRKTLEFLARTPDKILAFPLTQNQTIPKVLRRINDHFPNAAVSGRSRRTDEYHEVAHNCSVPVNPSSAEVCQPSTNPWRPVPSLPSTAEQETKGGCKTCQDQPMCTECGHSTCTGGRIPDINLHDFFCPRPKFTIEREECKYV